MADAIYRLEPDESQFVAGAARAGGELIQLPDGRAGFVNCLNARAIGDNVPIKDSGVVEVTKTADICFLDGGKVYWDRSANAAHFRPQSGDFYIGTAYGDAAAADATMKVNLNAKQANLIELDRKHTNTLWTHAVTNGLGVTEATGISDLILAFDAVAEIGKAEMYVAEAEKKIPVADGPICEMKVAIYDIGDNAALDINFGLANGPGGADFDAVTEQVTFHLDGSALSILAESDDGTTEVNATDTTVDAVDDTFFEVWIDCRDLADIQLYIDGVNVLPDSTFKLDAATGPIFPIVHMEKTSDDTTADLRVQFIRCRCMDLPTTRV